MKCIHCGSEWNPARGMTVKLENCPFCGKSLQPVRKEFTSFGEVLIAYRDSYGLDSFRNGPQLRGYVADMVPQMQKERRILGYFVECSGPQKLMDVIALTSAEQFAAREKLVVQMTEEMFIAEPAVRMICDAFWHVMTDAPRKKPKQTFPVDPPKQTDPPRETKAAKPAAPKNTEKPAKKAKPVPPKKPVSPPKEEKPFAAGPVRNLSGSQQTGDIPPMPEGMPMEWYAAASGQMDSSYVRQIIRHCEKKLHLQRYKTVYYIMGSVLRQRMDPLGFYLEGICYRDAFGVARNLKKSEDAFRGAILAAESGGNEEIANLAKLALQDMESDDQGKYFIQDGELELYAGHRSCIRVPDGVRVIAANAFEGLNFLEHVELPESVVAIENNAFVGCSGLKCVVLPKGLQRIGDCAFMGCSNLKDLQLPAGLRELGSGAFSGCVSLEKITIPGSVDAIGAYAFDSCRGLRTVDLEKGVAHVGNGVFNNCEALVTVSVPSTVTDFGILVFSGCKKLILLEADWAWKKKFRDRIPNQL